MTTEEILREITRLARERLEYGGAVTAEMRLVEDLELDSLRLFTLATEVENHFQIRLDEGDEAELATVGDLVRVVERKLHDGAE
jgi:acyl carrier protein